MERITIDDVYKRTSWDAFVQEIQNMTEHDPDDVLDHVFPTLGKTNDFIIHPLFFDKKDVEKNIGVIQYRCRRWQDVSKLVGLNHSNNYEVLKETAKRVSEMFDKEFKGYALGTAIGII